MLLVNILLLFLSYGAGEIVNDYDDDLVVELNEGSVKGKLMTTWGGKNVRAFLGIRYAKPPIRFKDPEDVEPWEGVRSAVEDGSACTQFRGKDLIGSEDCLFLNVFVPVTNKRNLPVLFYIHGGFLAFGSSNSKDVGPEILLDYCDCILVTINYRLSVLGFLSIGDAEAGGNFGFKDQAAALRWVNRNINYFGGDCSQVTLFGHSAGATSVGYHLHSEMSAGLFHRAILASSAMDSHRATSASFAKSNTLRLAKLLKCPTSNDSSVVMKCLREKPVKEIYDNLKNLKVWGNEPLLVFRPVLENGCQEKCFITERSVKSRSTVPLIVGYTSEDGYVVSETIIQRPEFIAGINQHFDNIIPIVLRYDQFENKNEITSAIKKFYLDNSGIHSGNFMNFTHMCGDVMYWRAMLKELIDHDGSALLFYYTHRGSLTYLRNKTLEGVAHGDHQLLIFPYQSQFGEHRISDEDKKVSAEFAALVAGFVELGVSYPGWRNFDLCKMNYLHIGTNTFYMKNNMLGARSQFWKDWLLNDNNERTEL
ncbi:esterase E4 [Nilaparvata lugens]|uniref:esterase E4 n=1 Tax=Nilaparvata lugens TaxID=108931 RepID=UPI00193CBAEF|nr:esterase E4 [Nilaparvata lugens]XP_022204353.2 esterase E4 [Nilaparvata lugens]